MTDPNQFGEWIADVERPAARYRGRYQTKLDEATSTGAPAQSPLPPPCPPPLVDPGAAAARNRALVRFFVSESIVGTASLAFFLRTRLPTTSASQPTAALRRLKTLMP